MKVINVNIKMVVLTLTRGELDVNLDVALAFLT